jgi:hypothetical protein
MTPPRDDGAADRLALLCAVGVVALVAALCGLAIGISKLIALF